MCTASALLQSNGLGFCLGILTALLSFWKKVPAEEVCSLINFQVQGREKSGIFWISRFLAGSRNPGLDSQKQVKPKKEAAKLTPFCYTYC